MREIFTHIAFFVRRQTRPSGILSFSGLKKRKKSIISFAIITIVCGVVLVLGQEAYAQNSVPQQLQKNSWAENLNPVLWILRGINAILEICVGLAGKMATLLVSILLAVAPYNEFLSSTAVANGWVVTRDIANMFFIVVLLVIAFGTILGSDKYNTKLLTQLLIMAVAINFSRTLIGLMIDASQIVMLTFVNGFSAAGAGNFINAFGVVKVMQFQAENAGNLNVTGLASLGGALIMGLILMIVACSVLLTIVGTLLFRIAYLWLLIVLAPITWLMSTIPAGKKYYDKWWDQFRDQLVVGPAMAFFLWLSLTAVGSGLAWNQVIVKGSTLTNVELGPTQLLTSENILSFIITIVLLLASVKMANELASSASGYGQFMKKWASGVAFGKRVGKGALKAADLFQASTLTSGLTIGSIPKRFQEGLANRKKLMEKEAESYRQKRARQLRNVPILGMPASAIWAPEPVLERALTGVLNGKMWQRQKENVLGTKLNNYRKRKYLERQASKKAVFDGQQKKVESDLKLYKTAQEHQGVVSRLDLEEEYANNVQKALLQDRNLEVSEFNEAKEIGLIDESLKDINDYEALSLEKRSQLHDKMAKQIIGSRKTAADKKLDLRNKLEKIRKDLEVDSLDNISQLIKGQEELLEKTKKDVEVGKRALDMESVQFNAKFAKGDSGLRDIVERKRVEAEQEAYKKIDPSSSDDELVSDLLQAITLKDQAMVAQLVKFLAKRGAVDKAFSAFGIEGTGGKKALQALQKVLQEKAGFEQQYALQTMLRVSNNEFDAGSLDNGNLLKVDKINGIIDWRTETEAAEMTKKRTGGKPVQKVLSNLSIKTIFHDGADGKKQLTQNGLAIVDLMNRNPKAVADGIKKGFISMEVIDAFDKFFDELKGVAMTEASIRIIREAQPQDNERETINKKTYKDIKEALEAKGVLYVSEEEKNK